MKLTIVTLLALIAVGLASDCPWYYDPVCGSNKVTYANLCFLERATETDPSIFLLHPGPCLQTAKSICPMIKVPLCGTDGKSYYDGCTYFQAKYVNEDLEVACHHECPCIF